MTSSWRPRAEQAGTPAVTGAPDAKELIHLSSRGDGMAFADLFDSTSSRVFGLALMITRDVATAEEVAEAVYAHVWQHSGRFDAQSGSALGWILTVAQRLAAHRVTSQRAQLGTSGGLHSPTVGLPPAGPATVATATSAVSD